VTKLGQRRDQRSDYVEVAETPKRRLWLVEPGDDAS
jgi:hypothetical protein